MYSYKDKATERAFEIVVYRLDWIAEIHSLHPVQLHEVFVEVESIAMMDGGIIRTGEYLLNTISKTVSGLEAEAIYKELHLYFVGEEYHKKGCVGKSFSEIKIRKRIAKVRQARIRKAIIN